MTPLMCTQNHLFHIDYNIPLLATKSTDYRTSTRKNHEFMPSIPQCFDCRVKARIKPELLVKDVTLRDEEQSTYHANFPEKHNENRSLSNGRAYSCDEISYTRTVQEKIYEKPPPPKWGSMSEMKNAYPPHPWRPLRDKFANYNCEMPETFRGVQPDINPAEKGFYKLLDIYLTENRAKYVPFSKEQLARAQEDFITIYNAAGKHKGLKEELPGKLNGFKNMYDKRIFKTEYPNRFLSRAPRRVPHAGITSEYQSNYPTPICSDFYPYRQTNGLYFPDSLPKAGPWQDLCPPGMYCTEYCHIGTGWPVRAVVNVKAPAADHKIVHSQDCTKI